MSSSPNSPDAPNTIVEAVGTSLGRATVIGTATTRMNFSVQHLLVAARLAREVAKVESANEGAQFGDFYDTVLGSSSACIILAVAGAESYVNEVFADRHLHFASHDADLVDLLWSQHEHKRILDKYEIALTLRGKKPEWRGDRIVQSFGALVHLRNGLTHFKPEWVSEQQEHLKLCNKLNGFVSRSPWLTNEPIFPRAWATTGTVQWAVDTVVDFIGTFSRLSGLQDQVSKFRDRLVVAAPANHSPERTTGS